MAPIKKIDPLILNLLTWALCKVHAVNDLYTPIWN